MQGETKREGQTGAIHYCISAMVTVLSPKSIDYVCFAISSILPTHDYYGAISGQSYKASTIVNYDSRFIIWGILKSGMTLLS